MNLSYDLLPFDFWQKVEDINYLKKILYSDTDSIFVTLKEHNWKTGLEAGDIAIKTGEAINDKLKEYYTFYLKKLGVDTDKWFFIDFKTETAFKSQMYLGIKKYYAGNIVFELKKSGPVEFDPPELFYKGLPLKKSDTPQGIKDFMKELLDLALGNQKGKYKICNDIAKKYFNIYQQKVNDYDFKYIARPAKNTGKPNILMGSRLFNTIAGEEVIVKGQSILSIHIDIQNDNILRELEPNFLKPSDYGKLKYLCFPYNIEKEKLKEMMEKYKIIPLNEFKPMRKEKRPRILVSTSGEDTPIKKIIDVIKMSGE